MERREGKSSIVKIARGDSGEGVGVGGRGWKREEGKG